MESRLQPVFIGPRPETIELMGDNIQARTAMRDAGLELVAGSAGAIGVNQAHGLAADLGYPVVLKASAGGGGRGMRLVGSPDELEPALQAAAAEARAAFGDESLYVEKAIVGAHHVEIQVLGDGEGGVLTLGERDCSIQRRYQKVIEEAPAAVGTP